MPVSQPRDSPLMAQPVGEPVSADNPREQAPRFPFIFIMCEAGGCKVRFPFI